jgi:hypothetical protein
MIKIKMRLPFLEIVNLELNDRIIVREKRYIINQYTTDLQTFETNFELIQDLRKLPVSQEPIVDCVLSEWSAYSDCVNNQTTRTRTVITQPSGGGLACGVLSETEACLNPVNCELSAWSEWSSCEGQSTQTRTRTVITQPSDGGAECGALSETRNCPAEPVDCVLSDWSAYSTCTNNTQTRTRTVLVPARNGGSCNFALSETISCVPDVDCVLSEWSAYSSCDGASTQTRTRTVITAQSGNGAACGVLSETRDCPIVEPCYQYRVAGTSSTRGITFTYIDCNGVAGEVTFGGGQVGYLVCARENTVSITDGEGSVSFEGNCGDTPSDPVINCELSEWSEYSSCSGQNTQTRTRTVITQPSGGGTACGALSETINCPIVEDCTEYEFSNAGIETLFYEYQSCDNVTISGTLQGGQSIIVCAQTGNYNVGAISVEAYGACGT